jgi:hypothetical protein
VFFIYVFWDLGVLGDMSQQNSGFQSLRNKTKYISAANLGFQATKME